MTDRIIDQGADDAERVAELALRPKTLGEFVGQFRVRDQLNLLLSAAKERKSVSDHILFSGPPGLGKTTLSIRSAIKGSFSGKKCLINCRVFFITKRALS